MHNTKVFFTRVSVIVILVAGWVCIDRVGLFAPPPRNDNAQETQPRVLTVQAGVPAPVQPRFVPGQEFTMTGSLDALGIFLYMNNEAKFYPDSVLEAAGPIADSMGGISFRVEYDSDVGRGVVKFDSVQKLKNEYVAIREALVDAPYVSVLVAQ